MFFWQKVDFLISNKSYNSRLYGIWFDVVSKLWGAKNDSQDSSHLWYFTRHYFLHHGPSHFMEITWKYNNYKRNQLTAIFVEILYHENGMISNATFLDKKKPDNLYIILGFKLRQP